MKRLLGKIVLYGFLMALVLEALVRIFHLYFQYPVVTLGQNDVVNYIPGQEGYFVTGNRRMNFAHYRINGSGFNSYHEFRPTQQGFEIALIGDSFIEGLHQNYDNSIGRKIENRLSNKVEVFEYGFSGYDLADELHLIHQLKSDMDRIDLIFIYLKFEDDIKRNTYTVHTRANLENSMSFKIKREVKLLSYLKGIGLLAPLTDLPNRLKGIMGKENQVSSEKERDLGSRDQEYLDNLGTLLETFPIDREKSVFLINRSITSALFIQYCDSLGYKYVDFGKPLENSTENTLIKYDPMKHWNDHGRDIVAKVISDYVDAHALKVPLQ
ncbi:MAG: hypothetical protein R2819_12770 [Allomuricauda sp.]